MESNSSVHPRVQPSHQSRLALSIAGLKKRLQDAQVDVDRVETEIAYKDAEIQSFRTNRTSYSGHIQKSDSTFTQASDEREKLYGILRKKENGLYILKTKLEIRQAKLSAMAPVESAAPDPKDNEEAAALLEITTGTFKENIFTTSDDGKTFTSPVMLRGVPVAPISEDGPYWKSSWSKLGEITNYDQLKREYDEFGEERRHRMLLGPLSAAETTAFNNRDYRLQRLMNVAKVVKQWFSPPATLHPNQLMAKEYLPVDGICQPHNLYNICNILNRLNAMYEREELAMQPLDFLLWRMSVVFDQRPRYETKTFCRVMIEENHYSFDQILRQAVIRGAQHTNDFNIFGHKSKNTVKSKMSKTHAAQPEVSVSQTISAPALASPTEWTTIPSQELSSPATQQGETVAGRRNRRKRQKSSKEATDQQTLEEDDSPQPKKRPFGRKRRHDIQIPLRPRASAENLAGQDKRDMTQTQRHTTAVSQPVSIDQASEDLLIPAPASPLKVHTEHVTGNTSPSMSDEERGEWQQTQAEMTDAIEAGSIGEADAGTGHTKTAVTEEEDSLWPPEPEADMKKLEELWKLSPYPKNKGKVSHGFIFSWLPCTEREALQSYY